MGVHTTQFRRNPLKQGSVAGAVDQNRWPSPAVWDRFPWMEINNGELDGVTFFDDFADFGLPGAQTTEINLGRYKVYNTNTAAAGVPTNRFIADYMPHSTTAGTSGGVVSVLAGTSGDIAALGTCAVPFLLVTTVPSILCFEARVAVDSILTNTGHWFWGLGENRTMTFGTATPLTTPNATATTGAMIGFNRLTAGLGVLNTSYADHAAAWTDVGTAANSTLAAQTWIKLGMRIDMSDTDRCVRFFVDNAECTTAMTKAALLALTFMDVACLGPLWAYAAGSTVTPYGYMDWWRAGQWFQ